MVVSSRESSASASAKILDTPRLGITSRHTMVRVVHDEMLHVHICTVLAKNLAWCNYIRAVGHRQASA